MRLFIAFLCCVGVCQGADRPIFLVTPAGVYQSMVSDGRPGAWTKIDGDVIITGFPTTQSFKAPNPPVERTSRVQRLKKFNETLDRVERKLVAIRGE